MPIAFLLLYALPAIPLAALTLPLYIIVPTYYSETLGLPLAAVGAALLVVRIVDAVTDPVIGWLADRWRPRFGRRRTFMAAAMPLASVAVVMLFWPPADAGAIYLGGWGMALSIAFTAVYLPYSAWGAEIAGTYRERSLVAGFREAFFLVGTLLAIALPFALGLEGNPGGLAVLGMVVAVSLLLAGGVALLLPEPMEYSVTSVPVFAGLVHMAANRPFMRLVFAFFINGLANGIPATLFLYFVSQILQAPEMRGPFLFLYFLAGIVGVPMGVRLAAAVGKHRAWCWAMMANCALFALVPLLGAGDLWPFAAICIVTGICLGFDLALPAAIQADVIDVDTERSGEQRSGLYFAAWSLATKLSLAAGVGIVFPLLSVVGFDPAPTAQNAPPALSALVAIYVWLPISLKIMAIALMWRFPLDEAAQVSLRTRIEARAAQNSVASSQSKPQERSINSQ